MGNRATRSRLRPRTTNGFVYGARMRGEPRHRVIRGCGVEIPTRRDVQVTGAHAHERMWRSKRPNGRRLRRSPGKEG